MSKTEVNKLIHLFWLFFIPVHLFGQLNDLEFDQYSTKEGLSNGYIFTIYQDSKGFIWAGTSNGLNRFDGISFRSYFFDSKDSNSIPGNGINSITEDSFGNLWIATFNGLCIYNREKDNFSRKRLKLNSNNTVLDDFSSTCIFRDSRNNLWLSTFSGVVRFKPENDPLRSAEMLEADIFVLDESDSDKPFRHNRLSFAEDNDGKIWVVGFSNRLFHFDEKEKQFTPHLIDHPEAGKLSNKAKCIIKDSDGDMFITIEEGGLLYWDRKKDVFTLFKPDGTNRMPQGTVLNAMAEDENGLIWIGDRNSEGLSIFNKKTGIFSFCRHDISNPYSLMTNKINYIYKDRNGTMWVGTIIGINKYSPGKSKFKRYFISKNIPGKLSSNNVLCFEEDMAGNIWIGTDGGGLNKFNRKTGMFTRYQYEPSDQNSLSSNAIKSICEDHEGTLWFGTYDGGLGKMKNGNFSAYYPEPGNPYSISNRHIWYVLEDSKQNLWAATLISGLDFFNRKTGRFYNFSHNENDSSSISNNALHGLFEDSRQNLYITSHIGVSVIDLNQCDFSASPPEIHFKNLYHHENKNSLSNNNVYCVNEDKDGNLWFGTIGSGIDKLDWETGEFTNYSTKDGLPGNSISSILFDDDNNLWLATDNGLAKFNPNTKEVTVFEQVDGIQNNNLTSWAIKTRDGEMFFGGADGFNSFYPEQLEQDKNQFKPPVVFTGLRIFNQPVKIGDEINGRVILENNLSETSELVLTHHENFFTFEFIALDFTTPEKNEYAYKMEGFDNDWIQIGNKREANYTNLNPGEYVFRVKASNNDGVWNEEGAALEINILPPWWEKTWFRILVIFVIISVVTYVFIQRVKHLKKRQLLLVRLVEEKTTELKHMNVELSQQKDTLEVLNLELNELNATKDKFFSIIAHDIKAPFNSILGFTELLSECYYEWDDEKKLKTINIVLDSSKNLYNLLENLLHWANSQRGKIEYHPKKINLNKTFQNIENLMIANAKSKDIKLDFTLPEKGLNVFADQPMLDTILRNLISNAMKFTNKGGNVNVSTTKNERFVRIEVSDNGIGIPDESKEKLFKIDSSHSTTGTNNEKGTGLGLILTREFVERNGGTIGFDSTVGKGSTFYFTLPVPN